MNVPIDDESDFDDLVENDQLNEYVDKLIEIIFGKDSKKHRRYEVFKRFFRQARPIFDQIIDEEMTWYEEEISRRELSLRKRAADLEEQEQKVSIGTSKLLDMKSDLIEREEVIREREAALAQREKQIAAEWESMQSIKAKLITLLENRDKS